MTISYNNIDSNQIISPIKIYIYEKVQVAYVHPPSCSCRELEDPSGPQTCMDTTEGAFGPLSSQ